VYSWTVLRSQCVAEESSLQHTETGVSRNTDSCRPFDIDEWCSDADDWDVDEHDNNKCYVNEIPISDGQESVDGSAGSTEIVLPVANIGHNCAPSSAVSSLQDATQVVSCTSSALSLSDEPVQLLQQLAISNDISTQTSFSTDVQEKLLSTAKDELLNESSELTLYVAAELAAYYIYVTEEPTTGDHSDHVKDLLARYKLQEGSSFEAELESGKHMYVIISFCIFVQKVHLQYS